MKTDLYTKAVLTIIAFCLAVLVMQGGITKAVAGSNTPKSGYALVPVNAE